MKVYFSQNYTLTLLSLLIKSGIGFTHLFSLNNGGIWVYTSARDVLLCRKLKNSSLSFICFMNYTGDASCDSDSYHCSVSGTCVSIGAYSVVASPTGYTCDGVNDCGSGNDHYSDELNCKSVIMKCYRSHTRQEKLVVIYL